MTSILELSEVERREFLGRVLNPEGEALKRRNEFRLRRAILRERFAGDIRRKLLEAYQHAVIAADVGKHATEIWNPWRRLANKLAVSYTKGVSRKIDGASKAANKALAKLHADLGIKIKAKTWDRELVVMNTVFIVPTPYRHGGENRLRYDKIAGDRGEVWLHPDREGDEGPPDILGYSLLSRAPKAYDTPPGKPVMATLDGEAWRLWDCNSKPVGEATTHRLGEFPGSVWRNTDPQEDYWDPDTGRAISEATVLVGKTAAEMGWIRKGQNRYLLTLFKSGDGAMGEGQVATPEGMLTADVDPGEIDLSTYQIDLDPRNFLTHMREIRNEAFEAAGYPAALVDPPDTGEGVGTAGVESHSTATLHAALSEVREDQLEYRRVGEKDLAVKTCKMAHALGIEAPKTDAVEEGFIAEWPPLPFIDTPANRVAVMREMTEYGIFDQVEAERELTGIADEDVLMKRVLDRIKRRNTIHDELASRNQKRGEPDPAEMVDDSRDGQTLAQRQGAEGGLTRAANEARMDSRGS